MATSRLHELSAHGVSVWIDSLSREMLETGELARLMEEDTVVGVTSNPTIFQKALAEGDLLRRAAAGGLPRDRRPGRDLLRARAGGHPRRLRPDAAGVGAHRGVDGYVSLEVDPTLAYDREATFEQAMRFHEEVDRTNLYVKIPATRAGARRDRGLHREGPLDQRHPDLLARALRGGGRGVPARARAARRGGRRSRVRCSSVASFFVSRVDTEADRRLDEVGRTDLQGKLAVANAKLAYEHWQRGVLRAPAGRSSRARAHARSAASGRRRRRRTRPTATCSTSRS